LGRLVRLYRAQCVWPGFYFQLQRISAGVRRALSVCVGALVGRHPVVSSDATRRANWGISGLGPKGKQTLSPPIFAECRRSGAHFYPRFFPLKQAWVLVETSTTSAKSILSFYTVNQVGIVSSSASFVRSPQALLAGK
jgi:hypothetical protein